MAANFPSERYRPLVIAILGTLLCRMEHVSGQPEPRNPCAEAPTAALRMVCEQLRKWDASVRSAPSITAKMAMPPAIPGLPMPKMAAELAPIATNPYQCMDLGCVCSYMGGNGQQGSNTCTLANGQPLAKAFRKEYRQLSDDERRRYHAAVRQLKDSGEYDRLALIHSQFATAGGAHSGPGFLPWHREYTKRFEIAIRQIDPTLFVPYWDSVLDNNLPNPRDSILWTDEFMGASDGGGNVVGGAFGGWRTLRGRPNVVRRLGAQGSLFTEAQIAWLMQQGEIENILAFTAPRQGCPLQVQWNVLEYTHGNVHIWVGGDMLDQSTSANDPVFFLHHSFVDLLWELWRQQRQNRFDREVAYPQDMQLCSSAAHFGSALMRPFEPWRNVDGLSNKYTDNLYEYAPRPTCTQENAGGCGSPYLFCDLSHGAPRCASKVRVGGSCAGFQAGEDVCHNGECQAGLCAQIAPVRPETTTTPLPSPTVTGSPLPVNPQQQETCFNENECCEIWAASGECQRNPAYMLTWCQASCGRCQPRTYDPNVECADRHFQCQQWSQLGECTKNPLWMAENCRRSCDRCSTSKAQTCRGGGNRQRPFRKLPTNTITTTTTTTATAAPRRARPAPGDNGSGKCDSTGCYNENVCCAFWGLQGQCARNARWMSCNCRVSCGYCIPDDYYYGSCADYHRDCTQWATSGECGSNPWMLENCRQSCGSCFTNTELRGMCRRGGGGAAPPPSGLFGFGRGGGEEEFTSRHKRGTEGRKRLLEPPSRFQG